MAGRKSRWAWAVLLFVLPKPLFAINENQMGCGFVGDSAWEARVAAFDPVDTVRVLAIWAVAANPPVSTNKKLPVFWRDMFDSTKALSVPRFFRDNSDRKYILNVDPFGAPDSFCFQSDSNPSGASGGRGFVRNVLQKADDSINFAIYDHDGDKIIEDAIFLCIAYDTAHLGVQLLGLLGGGPLDTFVTNDLVGGVPIKIVANSGVTLRAPNQEQAVQLAAHQWGHLFGLEDYFAHNSSEWWVSGSFSVMGFTGFQFRASPFLPYQNHKFIGWNQPIDVNATSYAQQIGDYMNTKQFYRLKKDNSEFFEVSYHSVNQLNSIFWESQWPKEGVLIAHIVDTVLVVGRKAHKRFDLELPHGLRDTSGGVFQSSANDSLGADSLDLFLPYWNKNPTTRAAGSETCLWNSSTKKNFDDKTNPSSRVYQNVSGTWMQNVASKIAIEDIQINGATASADLILNAQYGKITSSTTLGPGLVPVIGDLIVDSGVTLTFAAGTTVRFQKNYDNQKQGLDVGNGEIFVKAGGRLVMVGTSTNPIILRSSVITTPDTGRGRWQGVVIRPGGWADIKHVKIRNAYSGIEDNSRLSHKIENVRVAQCTMHGILGYEADSLVIRGCWVDSVWAEGGGGIGIFSYGSPGAKLTKDTVRLCYVGISIFGGTTPVDSCLIVGARDSICYAGILVGGQRSLTLNLILPIRYTNVDSFFFWAQLDGGQHDAKFSLSDCNFVSSYVPRTPFGIYSGGQDPGIKVRRTELVNWGYRGVYVTSQVDSEFNDTIDLGMDSTSNAGNNSIYTNATDLSWKYAENINSQNPFGIWAIWNRWFKFGGEPSASRFAGIVRYTPWIPSELDPGPKIVRGRGNLPDRTELFQNFPNPFNPSTQIQFNLEKTEAVRLEVFNILGQKVKTFLRGEEFSAGPYTFFWNGRDDNGVSVSSGTYVYKLTTPSFAATKKMQLVK